MDLTDIRRALETGDLGSLYERDLVDVKESYDLTKVRWDSDMVDDVLCMANTPRERGESAFIVLGVSQDPTTRAYIPVGLPSHLLSRYDDVEFQTPIRNHITPPVSFQYIPVQVGERRFGVIEVKPQTAGPYYLTRPGIEELSGLVRFRRGSMNANASPSEVRRIYRYFQEQQASSTIGFRANLPAVPPLTFGREDYLDRVRTLLSEESALEVSGGRVVPWIALYGYPGVGKSTVARCLCHDPAVRRIYPDGLLWAELGPSPNLSAVLHDWASVWDCDEETHQAHNRTPSLGPLRTVLEGRRVLLVVDDVWEAAHAQALWVGGNGCAMVVTTREIGVARSLCASDSRRIELWTLAPDDAVALLRELVGDTGSGDDDDLRELARECGNLPLALRVAAGQLDPRLPDSMAVPALLEAVRRGKLLEQPVPEEMGRYGDLPSEMRKVSAVLAASVDRLTEDARDRFRMVGAFAPNSRFDVTALAELWGVPDAVPMATDLVIRGLLRWYPPRWCSIHSLLRAYARALLAVPGSEADLQHVAKRHAMHYLRVFGQARSLLGEVFERVRPAEIEEGLRFFDEARENIGLAWQWSVDHTDTDPEAASVCSQFARGGSRLSSFRQQPRERIAWLEAALRACPNLPEGPSEQATHLMWLGYTQHLVGDAEQAATRLEESIRMHRRLRQKDGLGLATRLLGDLYRGKHNAVLALALYEEAIRAFTEIGDDRQLGIAVHNAGEALMLQEDIPGARRQFIARLEIARRTGDPGAEASALQALAECARREGDLRGACEHLERAGEIHEKADDAFRGAALSSVFHQLAEVQLAAGDETGAGATLEAALKWRQEALERRTAWQWDRGIGEDAVKIAVMLRRLGKPEEALSYASQSEAVAARIGHDMLRAGALYQQGLAHRDIGEAQRDAGRMAEAVCDLLGAHDVYASCRNWDVRRWQATTAQDLGITYERAHELHGRLEDLWHSRTWYERAATLWEVEWAEGTPTDGHRAAVRPEPAGIPIDPASQVVHELLPALSAGRCHLQLARMLRQQGHLDDALRHVEGAERAMKAGGSEADRMAVREEMEHIQCMLASS